MSAPGLLNQNADNLNYGFLAARAIQAISHKLEGEETTPDELEYLESASQFLKDAAEGVSLVTGHVFHGYSSQLVDVLSLISSPVSQLQDAIESEEDIADFFVTMANAISSPEPNVEVLKTAKEIFGLLLESIKEALNQSRSHERLINSHNYEIAANFA